MKIKQEWWGEKHEKNLEIIKSTRETYKTASKINDEVYDEFYDHFNTSNNPYELEVKLNKFKISDTERHFLMSYFFYNMSITKDEHPDEEGEKIIEDVYKHLGYGYLTEPDFDDVDFNRKVYKYLIATFTSVFNG